MGNVDHIIICYYDYDLSLINLTYLLTITLYCVHVTRYSSFTVYTVQCTFYKYKNNLRPLFLYGTRI